MMMLRKLYWTEQSSDAYRTELELKTNREHLFTYLLTSWTEKLPKNCLLYTYMQRYRKSYSVLWPPSWNKYLLIYLLTYTLNREITKKTACYIRTCRGIERRRTSGSRTYDRGTSIRNTTTFPCRTRWSRSSLAMPPRWVVSAGARSPERPLRSFLQTTGTYLPALSVMAKYSYCFIAVCQCVYVRVRQKLKSCQT